METGIFPVYVTETGKILGSVLQTKQIPDFIP